MTFLDRLLFGRDLPDGSQLFMNCIYCKKEIHGDYWDHAKCKEDHDLGDGTSSEEEEETLEREED